MRHGLYAMLTGHAEKKVVMHSDVGVLILRWLLRLGRGKLITRFLELTTCTNVFLIACLPLSSLTPYFYLQIAIASLTMVSVRNFNSTSCHFETYKLTPITSFIVMGTKC